MYQFGFGAFPASDEGMPQQAGYRDKDAGLLEPVARGVVRRFNQQYLDEQAIIREFKSILAAKEIYGPRLWDTPGVVGMQMGLADNGRPVLDVIVEQPGDIPKIPKFLMAPGPLGKLVKVRTRAIGYRLRLPKQRLRDAYDKLNQMLYNLQEYRTAGITYRGDRRVGLAAVLLSKKYNQYIPTQIMGFPVYTFYLA